MFLVVEKMPGYYNFLVIQRITLTFSIWQSTLPIGTRQEQTSYQRQDKIQINGQEIIHHYKNTHIPLFWHSTALISPNTAV